MIITGPNFMMIKAAVVHLGIRGIRRKVYRKEMKVVLGTRQVRRIVHSYHKKSNRTNARTHTHKTHRSLDHSYHKKSNRTNAHIRPTNAHTHTRTIHLFNSDARTPIGTPMNTCLKYLVPHDETGLNSIWVSQWSSNVTMPLQWGPRFGRANGWLNGSSVSGSNKCGSYCMAWGCGSNQSMHYSQSECWNI